MNLVPALVTNLVAVLLTLFNKQLPLVWKLAIIILLLISAIVQISNHKKDVKKLAATRQAGNLRARAKAVFPPPEEVKIELGWSPEMGPGVFFVYRGGPLSRMLDNPNLKALDDLNFKINEADGQISVSMLIRDKFGKLTAELANNEWKVAPPPKTWDRNYSRDTLEIIDEHGNVVLQLRCLADRIQLNGIFYDESGNGLSIAPAGQYAELKVLAHDTEPAKIKAIFRYPSEEFLGQFKRGDLTC